MPVQRAPRTVLFANVGSIHMNQCTINEIWHDVKHSDGVSNSESDGLDSETDCADHKDDDELDYRQHPTRYLDAVKMERKMNRLKKESEAKARVMREEAERLRKTEKPEEAEGQSSSRQPPDVEINLRNTTFIQYTGTTPRGRNFGWQTPPDARSNAQGSQSRANPCGSQSKDKHQGSQSMAKPKPESWSLAGAIAALFSKPFL